MLYFNIIAKILDGLNLLVEIELKENQRPHVYYRLLFSFLTDSGLLGSINIFLEKLK